MNLLQTWIIVGVPALLLAAACFVGSNQLRALVGYAILAATTVTFLLVPQDAFSAGAVGLIGFFIVATGRGTEQDLVAAEHHENRRRFTVNDS